MVKGLKYEITVYEGFHAFNHRCGKVINEIFIPSLCIIFNSEGFVFYSEEARNTDSHDENKKVKTTEIEIDDNLIEEFLQIIKIEKEFNLLKQKTKEDSKKYFIKDIQKETENKKIENYEEIDMKWTDDQIQKIIKLGKNKGRESWV